MTAKIQLFLGILPLIFLSCQKQDDLESPVQIAALSKSETCVVNDLAIENIFQEINYQTDFYARQHLLRQNDYKKNKEYVLADQKEPNYKKVQSPVISIDTAVTGNPVIITIDYGNKSITKHGRAISGTVIIEISAEKNTDRSASQISSINCTIDSIKIKGASTETYNSNQTTNTSNIVFTLADGTLIYRIGNEVREWLGEFGKPAEPNDDMVQTSGSIKVNSSKGNSYSRVITEPLLQHLDFTQPIHGIFQYSQNSKPIAEINYGNGTCEGMAQLSTGLEKRVPWLFEDGGNKKPKLTKWKNIKDIDLKSILKKK